MYIFILLLLKDIPIRYPIYEIKIQLAEQNEI